jgi:peptide/nickel transport system permease protein
MIGYVLRRLAQLVPVLLLVSLIVFALMRLVPGDPAQMALGGDANADPAALAALRHQMGLDQPIPVQYVLWLRNIATGDLGQSYLSKLPVSQLIGDALPATAELALAALLISVVVGFPLGIGAALQSGSRLDAVATGYTALALGVPNFWLGILLILVFSLALGWLPPGGRVDPIQNPGLGLRTLALPALALAVHISAVLTRFVRTAMLEVLNEDYVRTARGKGLPGRAVVIGHALRNALVPVLTVLGVEFGRLLGGTVIIESIFAWPGVGRMVVQAVSQRDYPIVQASILLLVGIFLVINLAVDVSYGVLDPRVRAGR